MLGDLPVARANSARGHQHIRQYWTGLDWTGLDCAGWTMPGTDEKFL
jgi:hypothetical protein